MLGNNYHACALNTPALGMFVGDRYECERLRGEEFCSCWVWFVHPSSLGNLGDGCFWTQHLLDAGRANTNAHKSLIPLCALHGHMSHIWHYYEV